MPAVGRKKETSSAERETFAQGAMVYLDHLYRVAFHLAKDQDHAQDLVQETFVRALASRDQFDPETNMKAWLTRILYNFFFDVYRQSKRWISRDGSTDEASDYWKRLPSENPGPESYLLVKELKSQITDVLRKIPDEFRAPIILVDMGDFSYEEAAEILSCPIGTIRSRLSRGRRLMQQYLRAYVDSNKPGVERK
jgi:RNA polymerase sigma-70 factor (ECF subfamily)